MNWRFYFPICILILAFFGMNLDGTSTRNQEIVVQFDANSFNEDSGQKTISEITEQLTAIGVTNVHVSEIENGTLKVSYFSTVDVSIIKNLFQKEQQILFGETAFNETKGTSKIPFNNDSKTYKLEVVKITQDLSIDSGVHGLPVEVKSAKDQYLSTFISFGLLENTFNFQEVIQFNPKKYFSEESFKFNTTSHKIPEVRAGPFA